MKVEIEIIDGNKYDEGGGAPYTKVRYFTSIYGAACPCDNEEEIQTAIKNAQRRIKRNGDIPAVVDKRKKAQLTNWF